GSYHWRDDSTGIDAVVCRLHRIRDGNSLSRLRPLTYSRILKSIGGSHERIHLFVSVNYWRCGLRAIECDTGRNRGPAGPATMVGSITEGRRGSSTAND